jgi:putative Holliday junction resolvase
MPIFNMPLLNMPELRASLRHRERLVGLDFGARRIGVALSDVGLTLATPHSTLKRALLRINAADIMAIARKEGVGGLVVGLPLEMDGTAGRAAQAVRDWTQALSNFTGLPAALWDERLSTSAMERFLIEQKITRKRRAEIIDKLAAAYILQAALDGSE